MKSKIYSYFTLLLAVAVLAGCKYDNQEPPKSFITGRMVYNDQPIEVRSNSVRLELWQPGYALFQKLEIMVAQDGTFSTNVFDGNYKITRLRGNGPWADQTDTIDVQLQGNTVINVPVMPYFVVKNPVLKKNGNAIEATFNVEKVHASGNLESVSLYLGNTVLVDQNNNSATVRKAASAVDLSQPVTLSATIPTPKGGARSYVYARIAVRTVGVGEQIYSTPVRINL
jgi:hypothetical protein